MIEFITSLPFNYAFSIALIMWILSGILLIIAIILFILGDIEERKHNGN